ncbi:MAG: DUF6605 domain-containing protein [Phycisphaerae bacterium]
MRRRAAAGALLLSLGLALPARGVYIEGYTSRQSYAPGETIEFRVSTDASSYRIDIYRDQTTPVLIDSLTGLPGSLQSTQAQGWLGATWVVTATRLVGAWPTGSYYVRFTDSDGGFRDWPIAVRAAVPGATSRLAFCMEYNTRNAYNYWGGASLYIGPPQPKVSFLRPMIQENGRGKGSSSTRLAHIQLEEEGFAVEYLTERDIHANPAILQNYDIIVFSDHMEYNTSQFYTAISAHHARGGHLCFLSANDLWWQVRYENDDTLMVGYKQSAVPNDPVYGVDNGLLTTNWYAALVNRPGEALQGVAYDRASGSMFSTNMVVRDASHWIFAGTGVQDGQSLGFNLAGGECDTVGRASPPVLDVLLAAELASPLPFTTPVHIPATALCTYYEDSPAYGFPNGKGGKVFASGCQTFVGGFQTGATDYLVIRKMFRNVIEAMLAAPPPP